MANIIQETMSRFKPASVSVGNPFAGVNPWDIAIAGEVIFLILFICFVIYIWKTYRIKILELEDRGRGSLRSKILFAKPIMENGVPRYQILGKKGEDGKPFKIIATTTDNIIPLRTFGGFYKDLVIMYKDKNGDYRPFKPIVNKDQINITEFYEEKDGERMFNIVNFLDNFFPVLKIDNLKMRGWYALMTKETLNLYKDKSELMKKLPSIMAVLFVIFILCVIAYMLLK